MAIGLMQKEVKNRLLERQIMHQAEVQVEKHFCWNYLSSERRRRSGSWLWNNPRKVSGTQQALQKQAKKSGA
jgi:hypothetical protein